MPAETLAQAPLSGTPYSIVSPLGEGGSGEVFLARHDALGKNVVIKILRREVAERPGFVESLQREARMLARFRHPALIEVHDLGLTTDGRPFFVMEYVAGRNLREYVEAEGGHLAPALACTLMAEVLDGLTAAHAQGVVHRDIKPENLLVCSPDAEGGRLSIKVLDFGVAGFFDHVADRDRQALGNEARPSAFAGTPRYMAPEQICGEALSPKTDLYAVGCVLHHIVTGHPPFDGSISMVLNAHLGKPPPRLSARAGFEVDEELEDLVARALSKAPSARPASATRMARQLRQIAGRLGGRTPSTADESGPHSDFRRVDRIAPTPDPFFGRAAELARIGSCFAEGDWLVTLLGPPGAGKTRLSLEYARKHEIESGAVRVCDLTEARSLEAICASVAAALGVSIERASSDAEIERVVGQAIAALSSASGGELLLVLDNCEQIARHAARAIATWRAIAPDARFLATSRERLLVIGERCLDVAPLPVPPEGASDEAARTSDAVKLFLDRVQRVRPDYELTKDDLPHVLAILRTLDGLPLAIELAAARMRVMGAATLLSRMSSRLDVLSDGARTSAGLGVRKRTMREALDWSWRTLERAEQDALARCSVFRGGFSLEAAESVIGTEDALDVVQSLRDKSLLRTYDAPSFPGEVRIGFYESVRQYAAEKLAESGDTEVARSRHSAHYLSAGERWAGEGILVRGGSLDLPRLVLELDNLLAAHEYALARAAHDESASHDALLATLILHPVLIVRRPAATFVALSDATLSRVRRRDEDATLVGCLHLDRAYTFMRVGRRDDMQREVDLALGLAAPNARFIELRANLLSLQRRDGGDDDAALALAQRSIALARELQNPVLEATSLLALGTIHQDLCHLEEAAQCYESALTLHREVGEPRARDSILWNNLALIYQETGRHAEARPYFELAIENARRFQSYSLLGGCLMFFAGLLHEQGDTLLAEQIYEEAITTYARVNDHRGGHFVCAMLGALRAASGRIDDATRLLDAAEAGLKAVGQNPLVDAVNVHRGFVDLARSRACEAAGDARGAAHHRAEAVRRVYESNALLHRADEIRFARRLLERALRSHAPANEEEPAGAFVVGPNADWVRPPHFSRVDLTMRQRARTILAALVEQRLQSPGKALPLEALLRAGWPGERVQPKAGANRVYVALSMLRELGLRDVLRSRREGYYLDPAIPIVTKS